MLDDNGITDFTNVDLTRNLLVYTDATNASATTENTVKTKLIEETYQETNDTYHTVAEAHNLRQEKTIRGHWIQKVGADYKATRDHYLVDKEDFNAPISYTFDTNNRMWYQRLPENYVGKRNAAGTGFIDNGAGWEGISLPFTAEIVTTNTKGEITHFYNYTSGSEDHTKGHEYWLREFKGQKEGTTVTNGVFTADFSKPTVGTENKKYTNTFLWDYYYSINNREDLNADQYPDASYKYYSVSHDYTNYPRLANATPYIIGFPGERYYEFDLSGEFEAKTAKITPAKLSAQIITFASNTGATIGVSDTEFSAATVKDGYTFVPNYMSKEVENCYLMNDEGNQFTKVTNTAPVPFRPYFIAGSVSSPAMTRGVVGTIVFDDDNSSFAIGDDSDPSDGDFRQGGLTFSVGKHKIAVTSSLRRTADVGIYSVSGVCIASFDIAPGETIETPIYNSGVYIIRAAGGHYTQKITLK